jgi:hypothetical protein
VASSIRSFSEIPPIRDGKSPRNSISSGPKPTASNSFAPRYPSTVVMPIFEMIFLKLSSSAATRFSRHSRGPMDQSCFVSGSANVRPLRISRSMR